MIKLQKSKEKDFVILNLSDTQLGNHEWNEGHISRKVLLNTMDEIIGRVKPDLITLSGDLAWAGEMDSYRNLADYLDSWGIPWAPVMGNHDQQNGPESTLEELAILTAKKTCLFERGPDELGFGNYVILIEEEGRPVFGLIMMDSHNCRPPLPHEGDVDEIWDELLPEQFTWYRQQIELLRELGCESTATIMHIPIYAYNEAYAAAIKEGAEPWSLPSFEDTSSLWKDEYRDSFGANCESICSHPYDNHFFDLVLELGSTKLMLSGHDHTNCASINYKGVRMCYALKTGRGCDFNPKMNGGSVITVNGEGKADFRHEFFDVTDIMEEHKRKNG